MPVKCKLLQLLEDFVIPLRPQTLYERFAPGPHCGLSFPDPLGYSPQVKIPGSVTVTVTAPSVRYALPADVQRCKTAKTHFEDTSFQQTVTPPQRLCVCTLQTVRRFTDLVDYYYGYYCCCYSHYYGHLHCMKLTTWIVDAACDMQHCKIVVLALLF